MARPGPAAQLPEGWPDLRALVEAPGGGELRLYRWEEQFTEAGDRRRAAHVLPGPGGPPLEALAAHLVARARALGYRSAPSSSPSLSGSGSGPSLPSAADDAPATFALRDEAGHAVTISPRPLPSRVVVALVEPRAWGGGMRVVPSPPPSEWARDPTLLPKVAPLLALASRIAKTRVACVDRFAELDPDPSRAARFAPPTLRAVLRGALPLATLCELLAAEGYEEDGDAWVKEAPEGREEVRLHDGGLDLAWVPSELAGVAVAPLSKSTRPPPVA